MCNGDTDTVMSQVYSVRLVHPRTGLPDSEIRRVWFLCRPWAEDIMKTHMLSANTLDRIKCPEELAAMAPHHIALMDLEDMSDMCLDGFHMVDFWFHCKLESFMAGWARWYVHVDRVTGVGWSMTLLLDGEGKTVADAEVLSRKLWLAYKTYFKWQWVVKQPGRPGDTRKPDIMYGEHEYENRRDKLLCVSIEGERGDFGRVVDDRMTVMPRMGEVYRTERHEGECLLWCHTNDADDKRKASTIRLWYPQTVEESTD